MEPSQKLRLAQFTRYMVHRRYASTVRIQGGSNTTSRGVDISPRSPRLHSQQGGISAVPIPGNRVPWVAGRFTEPPAQSTY